MRSIISYRELHSNGCTAKIDLVKYVAAKIEDSIFGIIPRGKYENKGG